MGGRAARSAAELPQWIQGAARSAAELPQWIQGAARLLVLTGVLALGLLLAPVPAFAADSVPAPVPAPYGGQLDAPDTAGTFDDERVLEVAMLGLGSLNGLAVAGVLLVSRFRGSASSALETRRALMTRTDRGVPSGPRLRARRRR